MKRFTKKVCAVVLCAVMVLSAAYSDAQAVTANTIEEAQQSIVTEFSYEYAFNTPGYAAGTIRISATEDGIYRLFWGDGEGNKLKKNGYEYSCLAKVVVKNQKGSYNLIPNYLAIPEGAKEILVYRHENLVYKYVVPAERLFEQNNEGYTFGAISDLYYGKYSEADDAFNNALDFLDEVGIDFVGVTGDITNEGEQDALDKYNAALAKHSDMTVLACTGNNDSKSEFKDDETTLLEVPMQRWYDSITSSYFTVDESGIINNKLKNHEILATSATDNPITVHSRSESGGTVVSQTIPGVDFVTEAGGNIFIFLNEVAKTGPSYDYKALVSRQQLDWLENQLDKYTDKNVFLFFHQNLHVDTLNYDNENQFYQNTGDVKTTDPATNGTNSVGYDFHDYVTNSKGHTIRAMLKLHSNVTFISGHTQWMYELQSLNEALNIGLWKQGEGGTMIHLSSVTCPTFKKKNSTTVVNMNGKASEGTTVTVYDDSIIYNGVDFYNKQYLSYATYITAAKSSEKYALVKNTNYVKAYDSLDAADYPEPEDMTEEELVKSGYNLVYGCEYTQSSTGNENTAGAMTNGVITGNKSTTQWGSSSAQEFVITLDESQRVDNIDYGKIYFSSANTYASKFDILISNDGEKFELIGSYTGRTLDDKNLVFDTSAVSIDEFKYVKIYLNDGHKNYGYQVVEFILMGKNPIEFEKIEDRSGIVASSAKNIALYKPVSVSSTYANESASPAALTDGKRDKYWSSDRDNTLTSDHIIIDLGKDYMADTIEEVIVNFKNEATYCKDYSIEFSADGETYYEVARNKAASWDLLLRDADIYGYVVTKLENVAYDEIRYAKINMNGHNGYGFHVYEVAVIGGTAVNDPIALSESQIVLEDSVDDEIGVTIKENNTQKSLGQVYNIYVDDVLVSEKVTAGKYTYTAERGEHQVAIEAVLGKRISSKTAKAIVVKNHPKEPENLQVSSEEINTIKVSFEAPENVLDEQMYNIYVNNVLVKENVVAGEYVLTEMNAGNDIVKICGVLDGYISTGITGEITVEGKAITGIKLEKETFDYTGGAIKPNVAVTYENDVLVLNKDYVVEYKNNINPGKGTVTVTGKGQYVGTFAAEFSIVAVEVPTTSKETETKTVIKPAKVKLKKLKNIKGKKVKVSWKKLSGVTGYEVKYGLNKKVTKKAKIVTLKKNKAKVTIKKLKKKTYYVKVRAYRLVNGKKYYGEWSKVKKVKIKK